MPIVLTANRVNQREQGYADVLGESYEFPSQYAGRVHEGEVFVYYEGTARGQQPAGYFGVGVIGPIRSSSAGRRSVCDLHDVELFSARVPLRDPRTDDYMEIVGPNRVFLQQGVRLISDDILRRVLQLADAGAAGGPGSVPRPPDNGGGMSRGGAGFGGDPSVRDATDHYAVERVKELLAEEFPEASIIEEPHNNPGYDIRVSGASSLTYVEVKGTTGPTASFHLSEGQRRFSEQHSQAYRLCVIYNIDHAAKTHLVHQHDGAIRDDRFLLEPTRYHVQTR